MHFAEDAGKLGAAGFAGTLTGQDGTGGVSAGQEAQAGQNRDLPWSSARYTAAIYGVDGEVLDIILPIAMETVTTLFGELDAACKARMRAETVRAAHTLKSTGAYLGARPIVWHALEIERAAGARGWDALELPLAALRVEVAHFLAAIDIVSRFKESAQQGGIS